VAATTIGRRRLRLRARTNSRGRETSEGNGRARVTGEEGGGTGACSYPLRGAAVRGGELPAAMAPRPSPVAGGGRKADQIGPGHTVCTRAPHAQ